MERKSLGLPEIRVFLARRNEVEPYSRANREPADRPGCRRRRQRRLARVRSLLSIGAQDMRLLISILLLATIRMYADGTAGTNTPPTTVQRSDTPAEHICITITVSANPTKACITAIANRDYRFIGYMSIGLVVPGVSDDMRDHFKWTGGIKNIAGMSDVSTTTYFPPDVAHRYAVAYNDILLRYLIEIESNQLKRAYPDGGPNSRPAGARGSP